MSRSPPPPTSPPPLRLLDPDEQAVEEGSALLLGDPLDLRVAEARVQGLTVARSLRSDLVGAGANAHLEAHLSVVAAVRARILESARGTGRSGEGAVTYAITVFNNDLLHFGGKDLHSGVTHSGRESHSGNLPAGGAVLLWLAVVVGPLGLHRRHGEDGRHSCKNEAIAMLVSLAQTDSDGLKAANLQLNFKVCKVIRTRGLWVMRSMWC